MAAENNDTLKMTEARATPKPEVAREGIFVRLWHGIVHFLREVQVELKKTSWPTQNELTKFTIVVMVTIVVVAVYLFVSDLIVYHITGRLFGLETSGSGFGF